VRLLDNVSYRRRYSMYIAHAQVIICVLLLLSCCCNVFKVSANRQTPTQVAIRDLSVHPSHTEAATVLRPFLQSIFRGSA